MRNLVFFSLFVTLFGGLVFLSGCLGRDSSTSPVIGATETVPTTTTIPASWRAESTVSFRILKAGRRDSPYSGILAGAGDAPTVIFKIRVVNLADSVTPSVLLSQTVTAVREASGTYAAVATFPALPARTVVGTIEIIDGNKDGDRIFRGAGDLVPGSNTVDLVASGTYDAIEMTAALIERLVAENVTRAKLFNRLALEAGNVVDYVRRTGNISYDRAYQVFLDQLPASLGKVNVSAVIPAPGTAEFPSTSIRYGVSGGIMAGSRARRYRARITTNPGRRNEIATVTDAVDLSDDKKKLLINEVKIDSPVGKNQVSIEILPATFTPTTQPIVKGYNLVDGTPENEPPAPPATVTITPASTAQSLAYDEWKNKPNTFNQDINDFLKNATDVATLTKKVEEQLETVIKNDTVDETFKWNQEVASQAKTIASETPVISKIGRINGTLKDDNTGAVIPGGLVGIAGTTLFDITDEYGWFEILDLEPGTYSLVIQRDGYAPKTVPDVRVDPDPPQTSVRMLSPRLSRIE